MHSGVVVPVALRCTRRHACSFSDAESSENRGKSCIRSSRKSFAATVLVQKWSSRTPCLFLNCMGVYIGNKCVSVVITYLDGAVQ